MTLIPLISNALFLPASDRAHAGGASMLVRGSYNPGARHRPLAVTFAVGVPVAMVAAVMLSPMIVDPPVKHDPMTGTLIELPKPPPPPEPVKKTTPPPPTHITIPQPRFDPVQVDPVKAAPTPPDYILPPLTGTGPVVADPPLPPAKPKWVEARADPRFAGLFQPDYPASEQRRGVEGSSKIRVLIGTDGRVKAVEDIASTSPGFFEETRRRALSKWHFKPATRDGIAEESWQVMTVRFEIRNG